MGVPNTNTENKEQNKAAGEKGVKAKPYEEWTRSALYLQAKYIGIPGRSKMDKTELIDALRNS